MINELKITVWEREFILPVEYDCYSGEVITDEQSLAIKNFIDNLNWIDISKNKVEQYCEKKVFQDEKNDKKDNIFSYIKPDFFFVKREKGNPRVALMCKYKYDPDHGIAIVFFYSGDIVVGSQDIIL